MRILKLLILPTLFLSLTSAKAMFEDETKIFLVHASNVMAENNTKIAGSQFCTLDQGLHIEPEGKNLRTRITLHHCLGGVVPSSLHGVNFMGMRMESHFDTDRDVCAYLDPLSSFRGEVFGGVPADFMTIDRHTYGESSIIIVPSHKEEEFRTKNPSYEGKVVVFDPSHVSLRQSVDSIIERFFAPRFTEINNVQNLDQLISFCSSNGFSHRMHDLTDFGLLEGVIRPFRQIIYDINEKRAPTLLSADQVGPLSVMIQVLLDNISQHVSPILSKDKRDALALWIQGMNEWLMLFKVDADLRANQKKSLLLNNPHLIDCISHRGDGEYLRELSTSLSSSESDLRPVGEELFPRREFEGIFAAPLPLITKLYREMMEAGHNTHASGVMLTYFANEFARSLATNASWALEEEELFFSTFKQVNPSPQLQKHLRDELRSLLQKDKSFQNQATVSLLNSAPIRALRQRIWEDHSLLNFRQLLTLSPRAGLLFEDLEVCPLSARWQPAEKRFLTHLRDWVLGQCVFNLGSEAIVLDNSGPKKRCTTNPKFSLFNYNWLEETIVMIDLYRMELCRDIHDPKNALQTLIDKRCFQSWSDLFGQLYDLSEMRKADMMKALEDPFSEYPGGKSVLSLGARVVIIIEQRKVFRAIFEKNLPLFHKIADGIETAGDEIKPSSTLEDWDEYIDVLLKNCVEGFTQRIGEDTATIKPNWERAQILSTKLYAMADKRQKRRIYKMMKPVYEKNEAGKPADSEDLEKDDSDEEWFFLE